LRPNDLSLAHIVRDFRPVALGVIVAADGSDIEPLMSLDKINRTIAARATAETQFKKSVGLVTLSAVLDCVARQHIDPCHDHLLPISRRYAHNVERGHFLHFATKE
jgi:hypothetical protein